MAQFSTQGIRLAALAAAVPKEVVHNRAYQTDFFDQALVDEVVDKVGIEERRFAPEGMCASDYCFAAAERLLIEQNIDRSSIDVLIFVSQTPDYRMPATAIILQERLGLPKSCAAFDINLGCSAFVYGLSMAHSYLMNPGINRVLLLDGETRSRVYSPRDKKTAFLFGDGGVAALLEKGGECRTTFSMHSDGSRSHYIKMDGGGYRNPSTPESLAEVIVDEYGNERGHEHGYMLGSDVFNFVIAEIPGDLSSTLERAGLEKDQIDFWMFHQANKFMNGYLRKKLRLKPARVPSAIEKFGNTSSVSIPLTMVSELAGQPVEGKNLLLSGFGVGMSWATCIVEGFDGTIIPLIEI